MADVIYELLVTGVAAMKLYRRGIKEQEVEQLVANRHVIAPNRRPARLGDEEVGSRRLLVGQTDGGRPLTLVVERTLDPTTWIVVTGWTSTPGERRMRDY